MKNSLGILMITLVAMSCLGGVSAQSSTGTSEDSVAAEIGELRALLDYARQQQYAIGGGLTGVVVLVGIVLFVYYRKYRKAQQESLEKDAWAQNQLEQKTIPVGATNPDAVLDVLAKNPNAVLDVLDQKRGRV